jgi:16S rRNA (guanine527-N7)-methyltransferase
MPGTEADPDTAETLWFERLDAGLDALGVTVDGEQRAQLVGFIGLLARWNRAYNLTAVRDPLDMIPRHLLDSLAVLPWVRRGPALDVGTGAGLPGLPLAIVRPGLAFTVLDGNAKKIRFVRQAVLELGLANVTAVQSRIETYRPEVNFATITARAVASTAEICALCERLAAPGCRLLALKGRDPEQEVAALEAVAPPRVRSDAIAVHRLDVPMLDAARCLIDVPFD